MKKILSWRRCHYVAGAGVFLIAIALIAGMVGCDDVSPKYDLTMEANPAVGGTATDVTNGSPYAEGTVVSIKAEANAGYEFVGWTAPAGTFADANAEETNFTMPGQDVTVIADFFQRQLIHTWYDLDAVRDNLDGNYVLMNDLDSTTAGYSELASETANQGKGWQPIGIYEQDGPFDPFVGTFDGQSHEIRDLFINHPDGDVEEDYVGLFGVVDEGGIIKNVGVVNADVTGYFGAGGLVGGNVGNVSNSYSTGSVSGIDGAGGLVGLNGGTVSDSYSTASVTGDRFVGGLMGMNGGTVNNSYSTGSVSGNISVGGLVGDNEYGTLSNSYSTGSVTGGQRVGGLVGYSWGGNVSDSYSTASVSGDGGVGGLVGWNSGGSTVSDSYSTASVSGYAAVGGLLGYNSGFVSNSYYNYDEVLINGENIISIGALFDEDFDQWLDNDKFLDVDERLSEEDGYYVINNVSDFKELLAFGQDSSLKFKLKNDLDLATEPNFYIPYLAGDFDGNGHKISNLSFNFGFVSHVGLFGFLLGWLAPGGNVTELGVENVNITGWYVGGLVGFTTGTVSDSYSTGSVSGDSFVGGLAGFLSGTVSDSHSTCIVTGNRSVGGLVGDNHGTVSNSYSTGSVSGNSYVGGLVGDNSGTVSNSFWDTETSGQATSDGGTGKTTEEMQDIATFSGATWDIVTVANPSTRNPSYIWNIVDDETYPFLSWKPVS